MLARPSAIVSRPARNVIDFPSVGRPRFFASGQETIALVDTRWDTVWMTAVSLTDTEPGA
jgi:hypothetical protein